MEKTYIKTKEGKLKVIIPRPDDEQEYDLIYLRTRREQILRDKEQIEKNLTEVDELLAKCSELEIVEIVVQ